MWVLFCQYSNFYYLHIQICGKAFGGKDKLDGHMFVHTGLKPHQCDKCDYKTSKRYNLEMHRSSKHSETTQKNFLCALCNKQFVTMGRVRRHMRLVHPEGPRGQEQRDPDPEIKTKRRRINARPSSQPPPPPPLALLEGGGGEYVVAAAGGAGGGQPQFLLATEDGTLVAASAASVVGPDGTATLAVQGAEFQLMEVRQEEAEGEERDGEALLAITL